LYERIVLRDKLIARLREMGDEPDHRRLVSEVLGIHGVPDALARRLVAQALVMEDRREAWGRTGEQICRDAPALAGVYVLRDADARVLYVGKAVNLRRRLRAHFAARHWRAVRPGLARVADAEWRVVGSEIEALLAEASLIEELQPAINVQTGPPRLRVRAIPPALVRDVIVVVPSVEHDSVELLAARAVGPWMLQRTRRNGADLPVHCTRLKRFFASCRGAADPALAPLVFSWLAGRGQTATRLDPHDVRSARELRTRLAHVLADERLFAERLMIYS
jgi:hypothetical protein